jgi:hypothetical protein
MTRSIKYEFHLEDGSNWEYTLRFDSKQRFLPEKESSGKEWTKLGFKQCPHCPLDKSTDCPVARNLDQIVEDSQKTISVKRTLVIVTTPERTFSKKCSTSEGLLALFGLVMASSGCPHLDWLRPMARFHLPFSDIDETMSRILGNELLRQYFSDRTQTLENAADNIQQRYSNVEKVNHAFIERIRAYCDGDADKNAIASLDVFTQIFRYQQESDFSSLKILYEDYEQ